MTHDGTKPLPNARHERYAVERAAGTARLQAMEAAGFRPDAGNGKRLDQRADVNARIRHLATIGAEVAGCHIGRVLTELTHVAYARLPEAFVKDGDSYKIKTLADMPPELGAAIREFKVGRDGTITIKLHDKIGALQALQKHLALVPQAPGDQPPKAAEPTHDANDEWADLTQPGRGEPKPARLQ